MPSANETLSGETKTFEPGCAALTFPRRAKENPFAALQVALKMNQPEPTMSYRTDRQIRGLKAGDEVVVNFHQTDDRIVAALIEAE